MNNQPIPASELIINADGSIFHLHLTPEQLAEKVILVGDPDRVALVASHFDHQEFRVANREFVTITGTYKGKRITVISTGIGCDNVDIVVNELDALANIDFATRTIKPQLRQLELVRIGTCGGLQPFTPEGTFVASAKSIGFDGLLNFYAGRDQHTDTALEAAFIKHLGWQGNQCIAHPYVAVASDELIQRISHDMVQGITIACGGFYGPQGRKVRLPLADPTQNDKVVTFKYDNLSITNFEMESSALAGLASLMGHKAMTVCMVIANRVAGKANTNYKGGIKDLIKLVLDRI
ncbi:MAG: nucleoside phosphorylase [Bacteroidales bacterium]|nr:nucleoside phosphorylase [Bacteroidales bacterium]